MSKQGSNHDFPEIDEEKDTHDIVLAHERTFDDQEFTDHDEDQTWAEFQSDDEVEEWDEPDWYDDDRAFYEYDDDPHGYYSGLDDDRW